MFYDGIIENKGIFFDNDDEALEYAMKECGIEPIDGDSANMTEEYKKALLEWFYSGNWITYTHDPRDNDDDEYYICETADRRYWEAERRRTESRL